MKDSAESGQDRVVQIPAGEEGALDAQLREVAGSRRRVLICRGLTGDLSKAGSLDELADLLAARGWSSLRFDYRGRGQSAGGLQTPTVRTMCDDVRFAYSYISKHFGGCPGAVVCRGFAARLALEALRGEAGVPFVFWAPIVWLRTSLELRGRLHELRRRGTLVVDGTEIKPQFINSLEDPRDSELRDWVVPGRRHVILQPEGDGVSPQALGKELQELIEGCGGSAEVILIPGPHPHPNVPTGSQVIMVAEAVQSIEHREGKV